MPAYHVFVTAPCTTYLNLLHIDRGKVQIRAHVYLGDWSQGFVARDSQGLTDAL